MKITGTTGNDTITVLANTDSVQAGAGTDIAIFANKYDQYSIDSSPTFIPVVTNNSSGHSTSLFDVEKIQFLDGTVELIRNESLGELRVNWYVGSTQYASSVNGLSNGGYVVTWASNNQDSSGFGVYAQVYDHVGLVVKGEHLVNTYTEDNQLQPVVSSLEDGGYVIGWISAGQDGNAFGVYGQKFDSLGTAVGEEFRISTIENSDQLYTDITPTLDGGYYVSWVSKDDPALDMVQGQLFGSDGLKIGEVLSISETYGVYTGGAKIATLNNTDIISVWSASDTNGSGSGVFGVLLNNSGDKKGSIFKVHSYELDHQLEPHVAALADGGFIVVWKSVATSESIGYASQDGDLGGIFAQQFSDDGARIGDEFQVNDSTEWNQETPVVIGTKEGGFAVTWHSNGDIYTKIYDASGSALVSEKLVNSYTYSSQLRPDSASLEDGGFVQVWESSGQDSSGYGIYSQRYGSDGTKLGHLQYNALPEITSIPEINVNEGSEYNYTFTIDDLDNDAVTYSLAESPSWLNFDQLTGQLSGTPSNSFVGENLVSLSAYSGASPVELEFAINVVNVNDSPEVVSSIAQSSTLEGVVYQLDTSLHFQDIDVGDTLSYAATQSDGSQLPWWLTMSSTGTLSGTPENSDVGMIDVKIIATDSLSASVSDTFILTITNANDAAIITAADASINEDVATVTGTATHTDVDANNASNVFTVASSASSTYGSYSVTTTGDWAYTLDNTDATIQALGLGQYTTDNITVTAEDGTTKAITITINGINDAAKLYSSYSPSPANVIDNLTIELWKENTQVGGDIAITKGEILVDNTYDFAQVRLTQSDAFDTSLAVNVFDVLLTVESIVGISALTGSAKQAADVNNDSNVNVFDVLAMVEHIVGVSTIDHFDIVDSSGDRITQLTNITSGDVPEYQLVMNGDVSMDGAFKKDYITMMSTEDSAFTYTVPTNTFAGVDINDSTLTITATGLPDGLTFVNGVISGTPTNAAVGDHIMSIIATDSENVGVTDQITITVTNTNDAPTVLSAIANQTIAEDAALSFTIPSGTFTDVDTGDTSTLTATLEGGAALPSWLTFTAETGVLSGTPTNDEVGSINITVTSTDGSSASISDTFSLTVTNTNDAPTVANAQAGQSAREDSAFTYTVPTNTFADVDSNDTSLTLTATGLPDGLTFTNGVISGTPTSAAVGTHIISIIATDSETVSVSNQITITVANVNAPVMAAASAVTVVENTYLTTLLSATDDVDDVITFSVTGGADQALFEINAAGDGLAFSAAGSTRSDMHLLLDSSGAQGGLMVDNLTTTVSGTSTTLIMDLLVIPKVVGVEALKGIQFTSTSTGTAADFDFDFSLSTLPKEHDQSGVDSDGNPVYDPIRGHGGLDGATAIWYSDPIYTTNDMEAVKIGSLEIYNYDSTNTYTIDTLLMGGGDAGVSTYANYTLNNLILSSVVDLPDVGDNASVAGSDSYSVEVTATDNDGNTTVQRLTVTLEDTTDNPNSSTSTTTWTGTTSADIYTIDSLTAAADGGNGDNDVAKISIENHTTWDTTGSTSDLVATLVDMEVIDISNVISSNDSTPIVIGDFSVNMTIDVTSAASMVAGTDSQLSIMGTTNDIVTLSGTTWVKGGSSNLSSGDYSTQARDAWTDGSSTLYIDHEINIVTPDIA
jgi:VCBS repeat-containing protein